MSGPGHAVTVIRLVRIGPLTTTPSRGVVAAMTDATLSEEADGATHLIVAQDRTLTRESGDRRHVGDIRVGDVVAWVADPHRALWVAHRPGAVPADEPVR